MTSPEVMAHLLSQYRAAVRARARAGNELGATGMAYEAAKEARAQAQDREYSYDRILRAEGMSTDEIDTVRRAVEDAVREEV